MPEYIEVRGQLRLSDGDWAKIGIKLPEEYDREEAIELMNDHWAYRIACDPDTRELWIKYKG